MISGGGTAGHVLPAVSVARALVNRGHGRDTIRFVGSRRGMEATLVPAAGFEVTLLPGRGLARRASLSDVVANVGAALGLMVACVQAIGLVARWRPRVVATVGGYAGVPCAVAAALLHKPLVVVNIDAVPGAANRLAGRFAQASAVSLSGTPLPRAVVTGTPVRPEVLAVGRPAFEAGRELARDTLGLPPHRRLVVVSGGSLGARRVNDATLGLAKRWRTRDDIALYHIVGSRDFPRVRAASAELGRSPTASSPGGAAGETDGEGAGTGEPSGAGLLDYRIVEFDSRLPSLLAACDVAVGRAGASTIAELTAIGVPSVLVPLPTAPADHQHANARVLVNAGAAVVLPDSQCSGTKLGELLEELLADPARLATMGRIAAGLGKRDAADRVADLLESVASR